MTYQHILYEVSEKIATITLHRPDRMTKVFKRWTGWLKQRPETLDYLARPKGSRAERRV